MEIFDQGMLSKNLELLDKQAKQTLLLKTTKENPGSELSSLGKEQVLLQEARDKYSEEYGQLVEQRKGDNLLHGVHLLTLIRICPYGTKSKGARAIPEGVDVYGGESQFRLCDGHVGTGVLVWQQRR